MLRGKFWLMNITVTAPLISWGKYARGVGFLSIRETLGKDPKKWWIKGTLNMKKKYFFLPKINLWRYNDSKSKLIFSRGKKILERTTLTSQVFKFSCRDIKLFSFCKHSHCCPDLLFWSHCSCIVASPKRLVRVFHFPRLLSLRTKIIQLSKFRS